MYNHEDKRVFFAAGDVVQIKQDVPNKPKMIVQEINKSTIPAKGDSKGMLLGVTCIWFSTIGSLEKHRFSTKDLEKC